MNGLTHIAGGLRLAPGSPVPHNLLSTRQDWASRLAPGQAASALPGFMASLFNLCGQSHRLCALLAIQAAAPGLLPQAQALGERLRLETAQEHLRRMALDWPRLLSAQSEADETSARALASQRSGPLLSTAAPDWPATTAWIEAELLHMPAATWLHAWNACGADWLHDWSRRHGGWLAPLLASARGFDTGPALNAAHALRVHGSGADQRALTAALAQQPGFALRPLWHGHSAHTGSWSRLALGESALPLTPWALFGARLAELLRLCQNSGGAVLGHGSFNTGPNQGLAWVEMARGLLIHQVEIAPAAGERAAQVIGARVVAPTEWNFHPEGEVAQRLAVLDPESDTEDLSRRVRLLMAAFDPCVAFSIGASALNTEQPHA